MPRFIVCLTFDHDHLSGFIARGLTSPTVMSRGEYDIVVIPRLVALLGKYGIKGTFFTPGHTIDSTPQAVMPYIEAGHEIAHHGWTHRLPVTMERDEEEEEIVR
ncbi:MAG: polysaccharide deacetylase family protein, partial [Proteobacteria bacterium]|nr:polysaccharide deacetylase family protein [Pseudomonadota bacterium]